MRGPETVRTTEADQTQSNWCELARTLVNLKSRTLSQIPNELRGKVEVARTHSNFDTKQCNESMTAERKKRFLNRRIRKVTKLRKSKETFGRRPVRGPETVRTTGRVIELDRTVTNSIKREREEKIGKWAQKPNELWGMVEVEQTRSNFDTKFCGGCKISRTEQRRRAFATDEH